MRVHVARIGGVTKIRKDKQTTSFSTYCHCSNSKDVSSIYDPPTVLARARFVAREKVLRGCVPVRTYYDGDGSTYCGCWLTMHAIAN